MSTAQNLSLPVIELSRLQGDPQQRKAFLEDLAIRYGYQRFDNTLIAGTVIVLLLLVQTIQKLGDRLVRSLAYRR